MCDRSYIVKHADVNVARLFLNLQGLEKTTTMLMTLTGKKNSWATNKSQRVCDTGKRDGIRLLLILVYLTLVHAGHSRVTPCTSKPVLVLH